MMNINDFEIHFQFTIEPIPCQEDNELLKTSRAGRGVF
jgi:hypothetical protein